MWMMLPGISPSVKGSSSTDEGSEEEVLEGEADDGRGHVDGHVRDKGGEAQEEDVEEQVVLVHLNFAVEVDDSGGELV